MTSLTSRITRHHEWRPPVLAAPMRIDASELTPLGTDRRGVLWFRHKLGELEARPRLLGEREELPDLPVTQATDANGERTYTAYRIHAPGTFAGLLAARTPVPRAARAVRPVLRATMLGARTPDVIIAPPSTNATLLPGFVEPRGFVRQGRRPGHGAAADLATIQSKGSTLHLAPDGTQLVLTSSDGRPRPGVVELARGHRQLLVPFLRDGQDPPCPWCGKPATMVTEPDGVPSCGACPA